MGHGLHFRNSTKKIFIEIKKKATCLFLHEIKSMF